jgi:hypothetical protein
LAGRAEKDCEASRQNATVDVALKLTPDEFRQWRREALLDRGLEQVVAGAKKAGCPGCSEDVVSKGLGANPLDLEMTPAIRPRDLKEIPVCKNCQSKFPPHTFPPGTRGQ